jgi:hypothetical protein
MMGMSDINQTAARIVQQSTAQAQELPADLEDAWQQWSGAIQKLDPRMMTLLRAAFEAGAAAAGTHHGRAGGLKGGKARAAALSKRQRLAIAKKAAAARWGDHH